jgi:hypothetical protein
LLAIHPKDGVRISTVCEKAMIEFPTNTTCFKRKLLIVTASKCYVTSCPKPFHSITFSNTDANPLPFPPFDTKFMNNP